MTDSTEYKNKLETRLAAIVAELDTIGTYNENSDDWEAVPDPEEDMTSADENTDADVVEELTERQSIVAALEVEYRDIKRALGKIEAGTYGICEIGGEQIEEKRLEVKPEARTCIAHMNDEEQLSL